MRAPPVRHATTTAMPRCVPCSNARVTFSPARKKIPISPYPDTLLPSIEATRYAAGRALGTPERAAEEGKVVLHPHDLDRRAAIGLGERGDRDVNRAQLAGLGDSISELIRVRAAAERELEKVRRTHLSRCKRSPHTTFEYFPCQFCFSSHHAVTIHESSKVLPPRCLLTSSNSPGMTEVCHKKFWKMKYLQNIFVLDVYLVENRNDPTA